MRKIKRIATDILFLLLLFVCGLFLSFLLYFVLWMFHQLGNESLHQSWIGPSPTAVGIVIFIYVAWRVWDYLNGVEQERKARRDQDLAYCPHLLKHVGLCLKGGDVYQCAGRLRDCPLQIER